MIDPRVVSTFPLWSDFTRKLVSGMLPGVQIPKFDPNLETWQDWGFRVLQNQAIRGLHPPDPRGFEDWQSWAFRFNQAIG